MKKIFYLKTCDTCKRILKTFPTEGFEFQEIKTEPIKEEQISQLKELAGSYESLFSRRAKKYKEMGLKDVSLEESDYKHYILSDYTFLQRPVIVIDKHVFIGSGKKNLEALHQYLNTDSNS
ncbi:MAG: ArsC/Spx/MgsR family protein [Lutimonas sp.]